MAASQQDLVKGLDMTGEASITAAEMNQLVDNGTPASDKGLCVTTSDVAGVPDVPDASVTTKWQRYLWRRITASSVKLYMWDPNAASDPTYLKWLDITTIAIGAGTITNAMLNGLITADKISSVNWSSVVGAPSNITSTDNPAAGDISGSYAAGFTIGNDKITTAKILAAQVTTAKLAADVGYYLLQSLRTDGTALVAGSTSIPYDDTIPQIGEGTELSTVNTTITPRAAASKLRVVWEGYVSSDLAGAAGAARAVSVALFRDATANAIGAGAVLLGVTVNDLKYLRVESVVAASAAVATTFKARIGLSNTDAGATSWAVGGLVGGRKFGGVMFQRMTVEELYA